MADKQQVYWVKYVDFFEGKASETDTNVLLDGLAKDGWTVIAAHFRGDDVAGVVVSKGQQK